MAAGEGSRVLGGLRCLRCRKGMRRGLKGARGMQWLPSGDGEEVGKRRDGRRGAGQVRRKTPPGPLKPVGSPPHFLVGPLKALPKPALSVPPAPHGPSQALWGPSIPSSGSSHTLAAPKNQPARTLTFPMSTALPQRPQDTPPAPQSFSENSRPP